MTETKTYTLSQDPKKKNWVLLVTGGKRATKRFANKTDASAKAIRTAVGADGGTVRILKGDGTLQSTLNVRSTKPGANPVAKLPAKKAPVRKPAAAKKLAVKKALVRMAAVKAAPNEAASKSTAKSASAKASKAKPVAKKATPKKPRKAAAKK